MGRGSRTVVGGRPSAAFLLAVAVACCCPAVSSARAQYLTMIAAGTGSEAGERATIAVHQDWTVRCETNATGNSCRISTLAHGRSSAGLAITASLSGERTPSGELLFHFLLPLDLLVANGVEMRFARSANLKLAYRSCHVGGCIVPFRMTSEVADRFRADKSFTLRAFDIDGSNVDVPVSLIGFTSAFGTLQYP